MEANDPMMPRIAMLIHGGPQSVEAIRARGLASSLPEGAVRFLYRTDTKGRTFCAWEKEIRAWQPDLLYLLNTAMPGCLLALKQCQLHNRPFMLDTGDVVYEMARSAGTSAIWKLLVLSVMESLVQDYAAGIIVRGSRHRTYLQAQGYRHVHLIRDGCSPALPPSPEAVKKLREDLGLTAPLVVGLMGSLTFSPTLKICYGWDLVEALARLPGEAVQCVIIGDGNGRAWLEEKARKLGVHARIKFCGRIPYEQVPLYLRILDVALSTQTNNLPGQVRTTGKLPEYMAAGCYILASKVGDAELLLPASMVLDYMGAVDKQYPARLAAKIKDLLHRPEQLKEREILPEKARRNCSYEVLTEDFKKAVMETWQTICQDR